MADITFAFIILSTALFFFLGSIWSRKTWTDVFLKISFMGMWLFGLFLILVQSGYLVKV